MRCHILCFPSHYFRNKVGPTCKVQRKEWHGERREAEGRPCGAAHADSALQSFQETQTCFSSVPLCLSFISLHSPWISKPRLQVRQQPRSNSARHDATFASAAVICTFPASDGAVTVWLLLPEASRKKNIRNICEDWWVVKESHPLTLCWHAGSPQPPVNLRLHIHQLVGCLSKVSLSLCATSTRENERRDFKNISGTCAHNFIFSLRLKRKST